MRYAKPVVAPYKPPDPAPRVSSQRSKSELRVLYPDEKLFSSRAVENPWRKDASGNYTADLPASGSNAGSSSLKQRRTPPSADSKPGTSLNITTSPRIQSAAFVNAALMGESRQSTGGLDAHRSPPLSSTKQPARSQSAGKARPKRQASARASSLAGRPAWDSGTPSKDSGRSSWLIADDGADSERTSGAGLYLFECRCFCLSVLVSASVCV